MQLINILTLGSPNGTGVFFPNGLNGVIKTPAGLNSFSTGVADFPATANVLGQVSFQLAPATLLITIIRDVLEKWTQERDAFRCNRAQSC